MPTIKSSMDLRNRFNDRSNLCREDQEPVLLTEDGRGEGAGLSTETHELIAGRGVVEGLLQEGLNDVTAGRTRPFGEAMDDLLEKYKV